MPATIRWPGTGWRRALPPAHAGAARRRRICRRRWLGSWNLVDELRHQRARRARTVAGRRRAVQALKPVETHRLLSLKTILTAGTTLAPESYEFVYRDIKQRVLLAPLTTGGDTLACFALGAPILPVWRGETRLPRIGDEGGSPGRFRRAADGRSRRPGLQRAVSVDAAGLLQRRRRAAFRRRVFFPPPGALVFRRTRVADGARDSAAGRIRLRKCCRDCSPTLNGSRFFRAAPRR